MEEITKSKIMANIYGELNQSGFLNKQKKRMMIHGISWDTGKKNKCKNYSTVVTDITFLVIIPMW